MKEINHPFGLGGMVQGESGFRVKKVCQGEPSEPAAKALQEVSAVHSESWLVARAKVQ